MFDEKQKFMTKKHILVMLCLALYTPMLVTAQADSLFAKLRLGVKVGATYTNSTGHQMVTEEQRDRTVIHDLTDPVPLWSQHVGFILQYPFNRHISLRTELNFIKVKTKYNYSTIESNTEVGLFRETAGTFEEGKTFIQIPLILKASFGRKIQPGIYGGFYVNGKGQSSGWWEYKEYNHATNLLGTWELHDPARVFNKGQSKGFNGRTNVGWLVGAEFRIHINRIIDVLIGGRYQEGFRLDSVYPAYQRNSFLIDLGVMVNTFKRNKQ